MGTTFYRGVHRSNPTIARITGARVTEYADNGETHAYIDWVDTRGKTGTTTGRMPSAHIDALLARARREGVRVVRDRAGWTPSMAGGGWNPNARTRWTDSMILASVRDGGMMTREADARARELAERGLIDTSGTWKLTERGRQYLREHPDLWPNARRVGSGVAVGILARLSLTELRRRQDLNAQQLHRAVASGNDGAVRELQQREREYTAAVMKREFGKNGEQQSLRGPGFIDPKLRKAYEFFRQHAGGIVGENARVALALARAEAYADSMEWEAVWEDDPEEYQMGDAETERPFEVLTCMIQDVNGNVLGSLGGIGMSGRTRQDKDYRRVVEAELALEAMHQHGHLRSSGRP